MSKFLMAGGFTRGDVEKRASHTPQCTSEITVTDSGCITCRGVTSSGQEAAPVLSCARPVHRTGRLFVEMPFETPGDDMSQDVSYCRVHRSRTSPIAVPTGDGNPPVVLLR